MPQYLQTDEVDIIKTIIQIGKSGHRAVIESVMS